MIEHGENCLIISGKQSVKIKSGSISFKNYFKELPVPFKIYADSECLLKGVKNSDKKIVHTLKNIKIIFLAVLLIKLFVLIIKVVLYRSKKLLTDLLKQFLKGMIKKNLIMYAEEGEKFQLSNRC